MRLDLIEKWIWLPSEKFPENQSTRLFSEPIALKLDDGSFAVARFEKSYHFGKTISRFRVRTSADTFFRLYVNGKREVTGPAPAARDFFSNDRVKPQYYATEADILPTSDGFAEGQLDLSAIVRMSPTTFYEYSYGHGGFFMTAIVEFSDGTKRVITTDESWSAEHLAMYGLDMDYDNSVATPEKHKAEIVPNIWHCKTAPIPTCTEELAHPCDEYLISAGGEREIHIKLDMIYTGYPYLEVKTSSRLEIELSCCELEGDSETVERYVFAHDDTYTGLNMYSAMNLHIKAVNRGLEDAYIKPSFVISNYPSPSLAVTRTDDEDLNLVLKVCTHTLKTCRQQLHLDSGKHCEPLACTGDYYIQALMTAFTFGDMRLASFDVRRTAQLIRDNDGKMFHTSYSLIWVLMLWDVYKITGEMELLLDCTDALVILLERFERYLGENGIIENPPDYMFVDWLYPDGISLHHPPKALGQTCLNMFYYGALKTAKDIFAVIGEDVMSKASEDRSVILKNDIITHLYDADRGLFFEGLNTPTPPEMLNICLPQNVSKRYYRRHANTLAAYFGIFDREASAGLIDKVMNDSSLGVTQPYFNHFLLEAVYRCGLRDKYTLKILNEWKGPVKECPYGLAEGFYKPEDSYKFDHSHAWGGTPAYSLPLALTGLEIVEPGYRRIRLAPSLMGLGEAHVEIPTPFGNIIFDAKSDDITVSVPEGITLEK